VQSYLQIFLLGVHFGGTAFSSNDHVISYLSCFSFFFLLYLHPLLGADELSGWSRQLVTAVCDEGDGLSPCERLS
jgi:hypothetical protein